MLFNKVKRTVVGLLDDAGHEVLFTRNIIEQWKMHQGFNFSVKTKTSSFPGLYYYYPSGVWGDSSSYSMCNRVSFESLVQHIERETNGRDVLS